MILLQDHYRRESSKNTYIFSFKTDQFRDPDGLEYMTCLCENKLFQDDVEYIFQLMYNKDGFKLKRYDNTNPNSSLDISKDAVIDCSVTEDEEHFIVINVDFIRKTTEIYIFQGDIYVGSGYIETVLTPINYFGRLQFNRDSVYNQTNIVVNYLYVIYDRNLTFSEISELSDNQDVIIDYLYNSSINDSQGGVSSSNMMWKNFQFSVTNGNLLDEILIDNSQLSSTKRLYLHGIQIYYVGKNPGFGPIVTVTIKNNDHVDELYRCSGPIPDSGYFNLSNNISPGKKGFYYGGTQLGNGIKLSTQQFNFNDTMNLTIWYTIEG